MNMGISNTANNDAINNVSFDLKPFNDTNDKQGSISPADIINEVQDTKKRFEAIPHKSILNKLLTKVVPVDFKAKVFPQYPKMKKELKELQAKAKQNPDDEDARKNVLDLQKKLSKLRLLRKHYKVACIDETLLLARQHNWGLCKRYDFIYLFNGAYWHLLDEPDLQTFLGKAAVKMGVDKWDANDESFVALLYKQFLYKAHLPQPERKEKTVYINLLNGTFEITPNGGVLRDFNRNDFITYQLPFKYDPEAKAPLFMEYLNKVQPDQERQNILSEYLAYVFTRHLKLEKTLLLYGTGANGKSVFFEIVNALFGKENVSSFTLQSLTDDKGYHRAKLSNKLVNYSSEINGRLETSLFKQLVSGEPVEARLPYGNPFTMDEYARLIFNCNDLPRDVEHTNAYFRRFLIVPFEVTIPEAEQDKELSNKIVKDELSGVFNWVLAGLTRLLEQKRFSKCDAVQKQIEQYKKESDSVQMFLDDENFIPSVEKSEPLKDVFQMYKGYAIDCNLRPVSIRTFSKRLKAVHFEIKRKSFGNAVFLERK